MPLVVCNSRTNNDKKWKRRACMPPNERELHSSSIISKSFPLKKYPAIVGVMCCAFDKKNTMHRDQLQVRVKIHVLEKTIMGSRYSDHTKFAHDDISDEIDMDG